MEPSILTSVVGITAFTLVMYFGFRYVTGGWNVSDEKRTEYDNWASKHGKKIKRAIISICILYYTVMLLQLTSFL
ncbi:MAG: hypothetical protein ACPGU4_05265 [Flavobacteriales bacterium]